MKPNILMEKYELRRLLGQGTFAKVYHGRNLETRENVAIKVMDKRKILEVGMSEQIKREISAMKLVRHPNIVRLYEVLASKYMIYIVMEYVNGGKVFQRVAREGKLKEEEARKYFQQLISALNCLVCPSSSNLGGQITGWEEGPTTTQCAVPCHREGGHVTETTQSATQDRMRNSKAHSSMSRETA